MAAFRFPFGSEMMMFECIMAMAPPIPVLDKLILAWIMAALAIVLVKLVDRRTWNPIVLVPAVVVSAVAVVAQHLHLPSTYGAGLHDFGIMAAITGALSGAICARFFLPAAKERDPADKSGKGFKLSLAAAVSGPLLGAGLGGFLVLVGIVDPLDRVYTLVVFTTVGTAAGIIGFFIIATMMIVRR